MIFPLFNNIISMKPQNNRVIQVAQGGFQLDEKILRYFEIDKKHKQAQCISCKRVFQIENNEKIPVTYLRRHLKLKHRIVFDDEEIDAFLNQKPVKKQNILDKYSANGFQQNWLSYFTQNAPIYDQDYFLGKQKQFYHGTQFTEPLKYIKYKRYSHSDKQALKKLMMLESIESSPCKQIYSQSHISNESLENMKFETFKMINNQERRSFQLGQQYLECLRLSKEEIWSRLHSTYEQKGPVRKKSNITTILNNFYGDFEFKNLCKNGYSVYVAQNRLFGFENPRMKSNYEKYGQVIYVFTQCIGELGICLFLCQTAACTFGLVGICAYEIYEGYSTSVYKKLVQFFLNITKHNVPLQIYLDQRSEVYAKYFYKEIEVHKLRTNLSLLLSKNQPNQSHFIGLLNLQDAEEWLGLEYLKWSVYQIKNFNISLSSFLLIMPEVQLLAQIYAIRKQTSKPGLKVSNLSNNTDYDQICVNLAPMVQQRLEQQLIKAQNACSYFEISSDVIQIQQTLMIESQRMMRKTKVYYNLVESRWICSCKTIVLIGIPCCHLLKVLKIKEANLSYYINERWLMND